MARRPQSPPAPTTEERRNARVVLNRLKKVYPEIGTRQVRIKLTPEQVAILKGPARIEYRELEEQGGALIAAVDGVIG